MLFDPKTYLENPFFSIQLFIVLVVALVTWLFEGYIRQYLKLSQMYAWTTLIVVPLNAIVTVLTLYFSERNLGDVINWHAVVIWIIGFSIAAYGSSLLIKG